MKTDSLVLLVPEVFKCDPNSDDRNSLRRSGKPVTHSGDAGIAASR